MRGSVKYRITLSTEWLYEIIYYTSLILISYQPHQTARPARNCVAQSDTARSDPYFIPPRHHQTGNRRIALTA